MSNKRSNSFRQAILQGNRRLCSKALLEETGLSLSQRLIRHVAYETLPREIDRKWYYDSYTCCPPPWFMIVITIVEASICKRKWFGGGVFTCFPWDSTPPEDHLQILFIHSLHSLFDCKDLAAIIPTWLCPLKIFWELQLAQNSAFMGGPQVRDTMLNQYLSWLLLCFPTQLKVLAINLYCLEWTEHGIFMNDLAPINLTSLYDMLGRSSPRYFLFE